MSMSTTPTTRDALPTPRAGAQPGTSPLEAMAGASEQAPAVTAGIATQYWSELVPIPAGTARLWFLVDDGWRSMSNPSQTVQDLVQRAFLGADSAVRVWYDGGAVVGLVVSGS